MNTKEKLEVIKGNLEEATYQIDGVIRMDNPCREALAQLLGAVEILMGIVDEHVRNEP